MISKYNSSLQKILFWTGVFVAVLLTVSNFGAFLNSDTWWIPALLSLSFPLLFCLDAIFFCVWLFIKPVLSIIFALPLLFSIPSMLKTFAFNTAPSFQNTPAAASLRVVTWNVGLLNLTAKTPTIAETNNAALLAELKTLNADVICLQEFFTAVVPGTGYNFLDSFSKTLGYPYYYFSRDIPYFSGQFYSGNIIYSRHKIVDSSFTLFSPPRSGGLLRTGILYNNDTIDIFTTRLRSVNFGSNEYETIGKIKDISDPQIRATTNIFKKLRTGYKERNGQLIASTTELNASKRPLLWAGDLNDVPTGYAYATLSKDRQDVWLKCGNGIGRTYKYIFPTLRIDCIFVSNYFVIEQAKRILSQSSDHYGLVTDLKIKKKLND